MALEAYGAKGDVARTSAPPPTPAPQGKRQRHRPIFVVQEHHAIIIGFHDSRKRASLGPGRH